MRYAVATLHTIAAAVLAAIALGFAVGSLTPLVALVSLALGVGVGVFSLWSSRDRCEPWRIDPWGGAALVVFALFALRSFLWLVFASGDDLYVFSPNNLGDFSLHLTYVRYLANGAPFWPQSPIFAGEPLTYPVGMDLFNSLLAVLGLDPLRGFIWVGLIASACTAAMLWRWSRGFAVAGFLFAGGTLGFAIFVKGRLVDYQADAAWDGLVVAWKSLPLALFVTQRGLLFALPAGLALLASWRARFFQPERADQRLPLWSEWLLYAALPAFHLHTFLFISFVAALWFVCVGVARKHLVVLVALAFVPATALVWCVTGGFHGTSMISLHLGWMQPPFQGSFPRALSQLPAFWTSVWTWLPRVVGFWLTNFGLFIPLVIWLIVRIARGRGPVSALALIAPAAVVFFACCLFKFAPWEWDNTKLLLWSYLAVLPPLWDVLLARWAEWKRVVVCFVLFFSGFISLLGGLRGELVTGEDRAATQLPRIGYPLGTLRSEIDGAAWGARDIPITDSFLAHPNYNHALLLAGRVVVMGYEGHLWSHGLDYAPRRDDIARVLRGEPGWRETAQKLGARWLYWGEQERNAYPDSPQPWRTECRVHAEGPWGAIYEL